MVLQKFQMCDQRHQKQFQFCCIKDNKIFCSKCWFKSQHFRLCQSTRCGDYQKLAHLVINRALQLKNLFYMKNMTSSSESFQTSRIKFLQLNYKITQLIKQWVDQKLPLFLWTMMNDMLNSKFSQHTAINCNKYDGMCTEMLKSIKNTDPNKKPEYLEMTINNFNTINHELEGTLNSLKTQSKQIKGTQIENKKVQEVLDYSLKNFGFLLLNIKNNLKQHMNNQVSKFLQNFDPNIKYKGVSFPKHSNEIDLFKKKQNYKQLNFNTQLFSQMKAEQQSLVYNGFNLTSLKQLQHSPQQILQLGKTFIKQKLFSIHASIQTFKSSYPYKYAYPISTSLQPDQQYESIILQLQKSYIKSLQSKSKHPFLNSLSIIIIGPQLITIRFINRPQFCYSMKIFNYKSSRESYYNRIRLIMGLNQYKQKSLIQEQKNIIFSQNLTSLQLAYCNFRLAYEQIFLLESQGCERVFQGEKITASRGMQLMGQLIEKWKTNAKIQLNFNLSQEHAKQLIV